jgi:hypothetical protein
VAVDTVLPADLRVFQDEGEPVHHRVYPSGVHVHQTRLLSPFSQSQSCHRIHVPVFQQVENQTWNVPSTVRLGLCLPYYPSICRQRSRAESIFMEQYRRISTTTTPQPQIARMDQSLQRHHAFCPVWDSIMSLTPDASLFRSFGRGSKHARSIHPTRRNIRYPVAFGMPFQRHMRRKRSFGTNND